MHTVRMVHDAGFMDMGRSVYQIKLTTVIEAVKDLFEAYDPIIYLSLVPLSGLLINNINNVWGRLFLSLCWTDGSDGWKTRRYMRVLR